MVKELTLEQDFIVNRFRHMTSVVGVYLATQYIEEVQKTKSIPLFMAEEMINKKVDKELLRITLAGKLPKAYEYAWAEVGEMFN